VNAYLFFSSAMTRFTGGKQLSNTGKTIHKQTLKNEFIRILMFPFLFVSRPLF
jgi:hypothetical protein